MSARPQTSLPFPSQKRNSLTVFHAEPFKPHALKVAEAARDRVMNQQEDKSEEQLEVERLNEIQQWRNHIVDLHRVLSVSQAMFLLLEQNNEALLRVAIEIATCQEAQKVLWWHDGWYSDEQAREWFRKQVRDKLAHCLQSMNVDVKLDDDKGEMDEETRALTSRVEAAEKKCIAMETLKDNTEHQLREVKQALDNALRDSASHIQDLEKSLDKMRAELKKNNAALGDIPTDTVEGKRLEEAEQRLRLVEEQKKKAEEKLAKAEREHSEYVSKSEKTVSELSEAKGKIKEMESQVRQMTSRLESAEQRARDAQQKVLELEKRGTIKVQTKNSDNAVKEDKPEEKPTKEVEVPDPELKNWLALEQKRVAEFRSQAERYKTQVTALEDEVATVKKDLAEAHAEIDKLRQLLADERARPPQTIVRSKSGKPEPEEEPQKPSGSDSPTSDSDPAGRGPRIRKVGVDEEEHQKVLEKLEQMKERNIRLRESNQELKDANEALEKKNLQLLRMLNQVKDQLKRITEIAEKKGYGKIVKEIMEESKVTETFESEEFSAFDRLWRDAKRREERSKMMTEVKMGLRPKEDLEQWDAKHGVQKRGNGGHRGSYIMQPDELKALRQSHAAAHAGSGRRSPSPNSEMGPILCERCGGEVGEVHDNGASTLSSSWSSGASSYSPHTLVDGAHLDAFRSVALVTPENSRRGAPHFPEIPHHASTWSSPWNAGATTGAANVHSFNATFDGSQFDALRSVAVASPENPRKDRSLFAQQALRDYHAINGPPTNSLRRPRTESVHSRNGVLRSPSPRDRVQTSGFELFEIQGHSWGDGETHGASDDHYSTLDDGRPRTTHAVQTGASSSPIQASSFNSFSHPIGRSQNQSTVNRGEPMGLHASSMKLPTISERPGVGPRNDSAQIASSSQEAMHGPGMQVSSVGVSGLPTALGSSVPHIDVSKRSKTPLSGMKGSSASAPNLHDALEDNALSIDMSKRSKTPMSGMNSYGGTLNLPNALGSTAPDSDVTKRSKTPLSGMKGLSASAPNLHDAFEDNALSIDMSKRSKTPMSGSTLNLPNAKGSAAPDSDVPKRGKTPVDAEMRSRAPVAGMQSSASTPSLPSATGNTAPNSDMSKRSKSSASGMQSSASAPGLPHAAGNAALSSDVPKRSKTPASGMQGSSAGAPSLPSVEGNAAPNSDMFKEVKDKLASKINGRKKMLTGSHPLTSGQNSRFSAQPGGDFRPKTSASALEASAETRWTPFQQVMKDNGLSANVPSLPDVASNLSPYTNASKRSKTPAARGGGGLRKLLNETPLGPNARFSIGGGHLRPMTSSVALEASDFPPARGL